MTRNFFAKVLSAGGYLTRRYLYLVETYDDVRRIVRYRRNADGVVWLSRPGDDFDYADAGYVCAVYPV